MKKISAVIFLLVFHTLSYSQLTGIKTIPGDYSTIAAAITDLNSLGVGTGGVTFNVAAGYTETAANLIITATGTLANPIVFQKSGTGTNPLITASAGVSATLDGIIILKGTDYITFTSIDLTDPATNLTATTRMEWGYALLKSSATDGCQNVTISNCTITLQRLYSSSMGIFCNNHTPASATQLTVTSLSGTNSNNKFYGNTIQNVNYGIYLSGFNDVYPYTYYDQNNDIGGTAAGTGNTIQNFGGIATASSKAIFIYSQNNINIAYNTINNTTGGGINSANIIYGIHLSNGTNANVTIANNSITLAQGAVSSAVYGISSATTGNATLNINNNTFGISAVSGSTSLINVMVLSAAPSNINVYGNQFINSTSIATTNSIYFFSVGTLATTNISFTSNLINTISKTSAGGTFYGYYNAGAPAGGTETLTGNTVSNISLTGATTLWVLLYVCANFTQ